MAQPLYHQWPPLLVVLRTMLPMVHLKRSTNTTLALDPLRNLYRSQMLRTDNQHYIAPIPLLDSQHTDLRVQHPLIRTRVFNLLEGPEIHLRLSWKHCEQAAALALFGGVPPPRQRQRLINHLRQCKGACIEQSLL